MQTGDRIRPTWLLTARATRRKVVSAVGAMTWSEHRGHRYLAVDWRCDHEVELIHLMTVVLSTARQQDTGMVIVGDATRMCVTSDFLLMAKRGNRDVFGPRSTRFLVYGMSGFTAAAARGFSLVGGGARIQACRDRDHALSLLIARRGPA